MKNKEESLISVIIPVYKVEKYLKRCVDSVIVQTYENIEIILVDDGSPDGCGAICDEYAKADSRVVVIHKENGGVSSARNAGIDAASGEYICFVDSDDYVNEYYVEKLYDSICSNDSDLSICGWRQLTKNGERVFSPPKICANIDACDENQVEALYSKAMNISWGKMYKCELIKSMRFDLKMPFAEDSVFVYDYLSKASKVSLISDELYVYDCRHSSASNKYYPKLLEYELCVFERKEKHIRRLTAGNQEVYNKHIGFTALAFFFDIVTHYFVYDYYLQKSLNDEQRKMYNSIYDSFSPYFLSIFNGKKKLTNNCNYYKKMINRYYNVMKAGDMTKFFELQKRYLCIDSKKQD